MSRRPGALLDFIGAPWTLRRSSYTEYLHCFVAEVIDDLDGDAARGRAVEGAGPVAVQGLPGVAVDFGLEGGLERLVGVVGAEEVGVADEEALLVVVGVDEPAADAVGAVAADFAGVGMDTRPRRCPGPG